MDTGLEIVTIRVETVSGCFGICRCLKQMLRMQFVCMTVQIVLQVLC